MNKLRSTLAFASLLMALGCSTAARSEHPYKCVPKDANEICPDDKWLADWDDAQAMVRTLNDLGADINQRVPKDFHIDNERRRWVKNPTPPVQAQAPVPAPAPAPQKQ